MAMKLTEGEIKKRLTRLTNLERLHAAQLKQNEKLRKRVPPASMRDTRVSMGL
jgi:hypothetical protein